jgi:hypothetical protein
MGQPCEFQVHAPRQTSASQPSTSVFVDLYCVGFAAAAGAPAAA